VFAGEDEGDKMKRKLHVKWREWGSKSENLVVFAGKQGYI